MIKNKSKFALRPETIRTLSTTGLAAVGGGAETQFCPNTAATVCPTVTLPTARTVC